MKTVAIFLVSLLVLQAGFASARNLKTLTEYQNTMGLINTGKATYGNSPPEIAKTEQGGSVSSNSATTGGSAGSRAVSKTYVYAEAKSAVGYAAQHAISQAKGGEPAVACAEGFAFAVGKACAIASAQTYAGAIVVGDGHADASAEGHAHALAAAVVEAIVAVFADAKNGINKMQGDATAKAIGSAVVEATASACSKAVATKDSSVQTFQNSYSISLTEPVAVAFARVLVGVDNANAYGDAQSLSNVQENKVEPTTINQSGTQGTGKYFTGTSSGDVFASMAKPNEQRVYQPSQLSPSAWSSLAQKPGMGVSNWGR